MVKNVGFQSFLDGIRELHARVGEEFDAIVIKRIMRSRDDNAGLKIALPDEASDARSGNHTGEGNGRAGLREASSEKRSDVRAGFPRVHADENMGLGIFALQIGA